MDTLKRMNEPLKCLSPEAINNRFLESSKWMNKMIVDQIMKESEFYQEQRIREVMEDKKITRAKALKIIKAEDKAWEKEYNSPLKAAERKIQQLEDELARIKRVVNGEEDPDDY